MVIHETLFYVYWFWQWILDNYLLPTLLPWCLFLFDILQWTTSAWLLCEFTLFDGTAYQLPDILLHIHIYLHNKTKWQFALWHVWYVMTHFTEVNNITFWYSCHSHMQCCQTQGTAWKPLWRERLLFGLFVPGFYCVYEERMLIGLCLGALNH